MDQGIRWENFDPSTVTLTEEEKDFALRVGIEKKIAEIKEILWFEKANRKKQVYKIDPNQILYIAVKDLCREAKLNIGEFILTEEFKIYEKLSFYFSDNEEFEKDGMSLEKGILLFGPVGCGKTSAINFFRMIGTTTFPLISCKKVANDYKKEGVAALEKFINMQCVCFDDLGTETTTKNFGDEKNVMTEVFLGRYDKRLKTHITTNLSSDEIENYYGTRVRSRLREMINQIEFPEDSTDKRK